MGYFILLLFFLIDILTNKKFSVMYEIEKLERNVVVITKTYGRSILYANVTEQELLGMSIEKQDETIIQIMNTVTQLHEKNKTECKYLMDFKKGIQDIYIDKVKHTRTEIDNHTVENWAYAFIDFKKCFLLGKPIQYTQLSENSSEEIATLNKYCKYEDKKTKDMDIYEDILTCGRGFRYTNSDEPKNEDEAPFELINPEVEYTEVVYSSGIRHEQLFAFIETPMQYVASEQNLETGEYEDIIKYYSEYTIYLRNRMFRVDDKIGSIQKIEKSDKLIAIKEHIITEYYINKQRISLIEIGKDLFNDINYLESLDKDDMEQFVNAIMVFTNAEVDEDALSEIKDLGAVSISSTEGRDAKVDLLQQRLKASDTQTYYNRLLTSLHQILGVPMSTDNGSQTSGDTGKAKLTGQGYTMAGIRIEGDENMFDMCDRKCLKTILAICNNSSKSEIKELKASEIESKFSRDTSDNLLIKTQGLLNLYSCDIPREIANTVVNLFNNPHEVTQMQESLFGKQTPNNKSNQGNIEQEKQDTFNTEKNTTNIENLTQQQTNEVQDVVETQEQSK